MKSSAQFTRFCIVIMREEIIIRTRRRKTDVQRLVMNLHTGTLDTRGTLNAGFDDRGDFVRETDLTASERSNRAIVSTVITSCTCVVDSLLV